MKVSRGDNSPTSQNKTVAMTPVATDLTGYMSNTYHSVLPPWPHQQGSTNWLLTHESGLLSIGMGGGKTKIVIDYWNNAIGAHKGTTWLILCPKAVLGVWRRELSQHLENAHEYEICILDQPSTDQKQDALDDAFNQMMVNEQGVIIGKLPVEKRRPIIVVVNYESSWRLPFLATKGWNLITCDESHRIKGPDAKVTKYVQSLSAFRRIAMTGTPMPKGPEDLFAQFKFIDHSILGASWGYFQQEFLRVASQTGQIVGYRDLKRLSEMISPKMLFLPEESLLELPEITHTTIDVDLEQSARRGHLDAMEGIGRFVGIEWELSCLFMQQITSGIHPEIRSTAKRAALTDLIEASSPSERFVVFCKHHAALDIVQQVAASLGRHYSEVSGRKKDAIDHHAKLKADCSVVGVQISAGGVGIDMTAARYAVFYEHPWSAGDYYQAVKRLHRPGQEHPVTIYHLEVTNSIDGIIRAAIGRKQSLSDSLLSKAKEH